MSNLKEQLQSAVAIYVKASMDLPEWAKISPGMRAAIELHTQQSILSGITLCTSLQVANDGHPDVTPQAIRTCAIEMGRELDLTAETLSQVLRIPIRKTDAAEKDEDFKG